MELKQVININFVNEDQKKLLVLLKIGLGSGEMLDTEIMEEFGLNREELDKMISEFENLGLVKKQKILEETMIPDASKIVDFIEEIRILVYICRRKNVNFDKLQIRYDFESDWFNRKASKWRKNKLIRFRRGKGRTLIDLFSTDNLKVYLKELLEYPEKNWIHHKKKVIMLPEELLSAFDEIVYIINTEGLDYP